MPRHAVDDLAAFPVDTHRRRRDIGAFVQIEFLELGVQSAQRLCGRRLALIQPRLDESREHARRDALARDVGKKAHRLAAHFVHVGQVAADLAAGNVHEGIVCARSAARGRQKPLLDILRRVHLARDLRGIGVVHDAEIVFSEGRDADAEGDIPLPAAHDEFAQRPTAVLHRIGKERAHGTIGAPHPLAAHLSGRAARRILERPPGSCRAEALAEGAVGIAHLHIFVHDDRRRGDIVEHFPVKIHISLGTF